MAETTPKSDYPAAPSTAAYKGMLDRAQGCLLGQAIGDALGALVEFQGPDAIRQRYPDGVRELADGGTWNTLAGQPTDDTELALALARVLATADRYDPEAVVAAYARWYASSPFDMGGTTAQALKAAVRAPEGRRAAAARRSANPDSQANGSLMRIATIGIWAHSPAEAAAVAADDSRLTHPHPVCTAACAAFAAAIAAGISSGDRAAMLYAAMSAAGDTVPVRDALVAARGDGSLPDAMHQQGWVLIALQHAFRHLARGEDVEQALIGIVGQGGDTDTNAAIAGALLGAAAGRSAWPARWVGPVLACRPTAAAGAAHPRPKEYWPVDIPDLAAQLWERCYVTRSARPTSPRFGAPRSDATAPD